MVLENLSRQAQDAGESMEKLSIAELAIYAGLTLKDLASFRLPSAVIFANALESLVEWTSNRMISEDPNNAQAKLGPVFETICGLAAKICNVKDPKGNLVTGSQALIANKDKVTGALVTVMNSLGMLNSLRSFGSGFVAKNRTQVRASQNSRAGKLANIAGIIFPGFNTVSMLVCAALKEYYGLAMRKNSSQMTDQHQKLSASLFTGANEDMRCAAKSALAVIVDALKFTGMPGAALIDGLGGLGLNAFGIVNGVNGLRGAAEEEAIGPTPLLLSSNPILRSFGKWYLELTGVKAAIS